jgi:hypothetical protein
VKEGVPNITDIYISKRQKQGFRHLSWRRDKTATEEESLLICGEFISIESETLNVAERMEDDDSLSSR